MGLNYTQEWIMDAWAAAKKLIERMENAPPRVRHLAKYGKKARTCKKNLHRMVKVR